MTQQPYIPRETPMLREGGKIAREWDASFLQPLVLAVNALTTAVFPQGQFANPNTNVVASPGALYTYSGGGVGVTLWVKESGSNTNLGWVAK